MKTRPTVLSAEIAGDGHGGLEVSWELAGDGPVEIAVGPSPESIDHDHPVARVEAGTRISLRGLGSGRHYVSVAPAGGGSAVVAAERLLTLEGAANFRDLGGYRTAGGGWTRWGLVFRSDAPHRLTTADLATVERLGLRVVYDLRTDAERDNAPSALPAAVRRELLAIGGAAGQHKEHGESLRQGRLAEVPDDFLVGVYTAMVDHDAPTFGRLLTGLTEPGGLPALFHCTAGKDRTGMSAALLLSALGVDETTVLDDYELSTVFFTERRMTRLRPKLADAGIDVEHYFAVFGAPRKAMAAALAAVRRRHGSTEGYLVERAGVAPDVLAELRARLVSTAGP
jgi:protein-tyrosine phosphatase